jgi:hypothetical protein
VSARILRAADWPGYDAPIAPSRPPKPKRLNPEHALQRTLVEHLEMMARRDVFWTAIPLGMAGIVWRRKIKELGGRNGSPDMLFIIPEARPFCGTWGVPHGLELKAPGGTQSPAQKQAMKDWRAAGGVYEVARGLDEALEVLTRWQVLR